MRKTKFLTDIKRPPFDLNTIVGRISDLGKLADSLQKGDHLLLLNGMGGIGKTTLAAYYVHSFQSQYRHIAWVTYTIGLLDSIFTQINDYETLGIEFEQDADHLLHRILNAMERLEGQNLLILDNVNTKVDAEDISKNFNRLPQNWQLLITSRVKIGNLPAYGIGVLEEEKAIELFCLYCPLKNENDLPVLQELLLLVGRHTLVVEMLAKTLKQLHHWSLSKMLDKLKEKGLSNLDTGIEVSTLHNKRENTILHQYIRQIFEINFKEIKDQEKDFLRYFSILPPFAHPFEVLSKILTDGSESEADQLNASLQQLIKKGFLEKQIKNEELGMQEGFFMHPVLQEVIRNKMTPDVINCSNLISNLENILDEESLMASINYLPFVKLITEIIPLGTIEMAGLCWSLSDRYRDVGKLPESLHYIKRANEVYLELGDNRNIAVTYQRLGGIYESQGDYEKALEYYNQRSQLGEELHQSNPHSESLKNGLAISYEKLGGIYESQGDYEKALEYYNQQTKLFEELHQSNPLNIHLFNGLAISFFKLGGIYLIIKSPDIAKENYEKAIDIWNELKEAVGLPKFQEYVDETQEKLDKLT